MIGINRSRVCGPGKEQNSTYVMRSMLETRAFDRGTFAHPHSFQQSSSLKYREDSTMIFSLHNNKENCVGTSK
jgi:hypothetical protein